MWGVGVFRNYDGNRLPSATVVSAAAAGISLL